jgi:DNA polymerase-3 subunit alpha
MDFVHLHVHSHYSLLYGIMKPKKLVAYAKERGFSAISLVDYGSMYGAIEFYQACVDNGVKPIIGFEAYIAPRRMEDRDPELDKDLSNLVLIAENYQGYRNLMLLTSEGHIRGAFNGKPRLDKETLKKYSKNIIALSAGLKGEIPKLLRANKLDEARKIALEYNEIFGQENFFLELQDHPALEGQIDVNTKLITLSKETGIPLVVTRDVFYAKPEYAEAQDIMCCIREGWKVQYTDRENYRHVDRSLNSGEDIASRFRHIPEALENTVKIAERINVVIELNKWHFAPVPLDEGKTYDEMLREQTFANVGKYYTEITQEITDRIEYELDIIKTKGYSPYFLCVADFVGFAKSRGIVETTRGSAAGSLVSYVMGITTVDPMRFRLPFERFLNPFRPSAPDVDTDFADDRRDEMIKYVTDKYGSDKVAQIITFGTMAAKASVRDVGRALGLSYSFCDQVSKLIPMGAQGFPMTIARAIKEEPDLKKLYDTNEDVKRLLELAQKVEGCARHTSIHAAGVVISPTTLTDFSPIQYEVGGTRITTQYEMKAVEAAGVLKNDFLGIRNLSILGKAVEIVKVTTGEVIDIYKLPLDDTKTFEMLARGETMGTFQLGGSGMTRWVKELKPTNIDDIMAMVALYRPGPMESIPEYIKRKYDPSLVTYFDPRLEKILNASYGLLVYQDDVMLTAIALAGYDWMEADKFRKAMGKKIPEEMAQQKEKFYKGCLEIGKVKKDIVDEMWKAIEPFASYGFNKCLVGSTRIIDSKTGKLITVQDLFCNFTKKKQKFSTVSLSKNYTLDSRKVEDVIENGKKKVFRLKTRLGKEIIATANHPFLKFAGWSELSNLHVGDRIATPRVLPYTASASLSEKKLTTLGYLIAEGNLCHPSGIYFYSTVREEVDKFIESARIFKNTAFTIDQSKSTTAVFVKRKNLKEKNGLFEWIKDLGLLNKTATQKEIPSIIFQLPKKQVGIFLAALWQGDGCIHTDRGGQVYYATSSKVLAHQVQHLLLRLGIVSTIHQKQFKYRGSYKEGYTVNLSRYTNILEFSRFIGPYLIGAKQNALKILVQQNAVLSGRIEKGAARGTKDIIPGEVLPLVRREMENQNVSVSQIATDLHIASRLFHSDTRKTGFQRETIEKVGKYLKSKKLLSIAQSDIYWDEVVSIEPAGMEQTYDLTIADVHNFVANDIIVHNSHAASYGIVAYQTSYMKAHYPVQYMTAVLHAEAGDAEKVAAIVHECHRINIEVLPPDVNESFRNFAMVSKPGEKGRIRFGLSAIKNVGEHICEMIYNERKKNGVYKNLEDFLKRVQDKDLNKRSVESLGQSGALDCFGIDRGILLGNTEQLLAFSRHERERNETQQDSLFGGAMFDFESKVSLKAAIEATLDDKLKWEKQLLGIYLSSHPCAYYEEKLHGIATLLSEVEDYPRDEWVITCGVVASVKKKITKKGEIMLFVTIEDRSGGMELLVFPKTYATTQELWKEGNVLCVVGKTPKEDGDNKIFVENAYSLTKENVEGIGRQVKLGKKVTGKSGTEAQAQKEKAIRIEISPDELKEKMDILKEFFGQNVGDYRVYFSVAGNNIKTGSLIRWESGVEEKLRGLIGAFAIDVFD